MSLPIQHPSVKTADFIITETDKIEDEQKKIESYVSAINDYLIAIKTSNNIFIKADILAQLVSLCQLIGSLIPGYIQSQSDSGSLNIQEKLTIPLIGNKCLNDFISFFMKHAHINELTDELINNINKERRNYISTSIKAYTWAGTGAINFIVCVTSVIAALTVPPLLMFTLFTAAISGIMSFLSAANFANNSQEKINIKKLLRQDIVKLSNLIDNTLAAAQKIDPEKKLSSTAIKEIKAKQIPLKKSKMIVDRINDIASYYLNCGFFNSRTDTQHHYTRLPIAPKISSRPK